MSGEAGKAVYQRCSRIETGNGILKGRGLGIMRVRQSRLRHPLAGDRS